MAFSVKTIAYLVVQLLVDAPRLLKSSARTHVPARDVDSACKYPV